MADVQSAKNLMPERNEGKVVEKIRTVGVKNVLIDQLIDLRLFIGSRDFLKISERYQKKFLRMEREISEYENE